MTRVVLERFPDQVTIRTMGEGFTWETQDKERDIAACRAGAWPSPATTTFPMMTSATLAGSTSDRSRAARITTPPSSGAVREDRPPRKRPIGVRPPPRITGVLASSPMGTRLLVVFRPASAGGDSLVI